MAKHLIVHEFLAGHYGLEYHPIGEHEIEQRSFAELTAAIWTETRDP